MPRVDGKYLIEDCDGQIVYTFMRCLYKLFIRWRVEERVRHENRALRARKEGVRGVYF